MQPEDWDEFDWGDEAFAEPPPEEPMTPEQRQALAAFWFTELYPDGTPIPTHRLRKTN